MTEAVISPVNIQQRQDIGIRPGDTVRVHQKIQEKGKTRIQVFEGIVLARKHGNEAGATFTVRRASDGYGVEKIFPLYSPAIDKIEIVRRAKVRRSKLYYIREKAARQIRRQMRRMMMVDLTTGSDEEEKAEAARKAEQAEEKEEEDPSTNAQDDSSKDESEDTPKEEPEQDDKESTSKEEPAKEKKEEQREEQKEEKSAE